MTANANHLKKCTAMVNYHQVFIIAHWLLVILIIFLYATGYYRANFTIQNEPLNWYLLVWHMNAGLLAIIFTLLIFSIKLLAPNVTSYPSGFIVKIAVKIFHFFLYSMLLVIPIAAYIGLGFDFPLVGVTLVPGIIRFEWIHKLINEYLKIPLISFMEPFAIFHRDTGADIILPVLFVTHVTAAIYHHFILRDEVLKSMFVFKQK